MAALLRVHRKNWLKNGGLDLKVDVLNSFIFYFEKQDELQSVLQKVPWSFDGELLALIKLTPGMSPSSIPLDTIPV